MGLNTPVVPVVVETVSELFFAKREDPLVPPNALDGVLPVEEVAVSDVDATVPNKLLATGFAPNVAGADVGMGG